uniref:Uncharacterized protein n=1 Tax=Heterorhabditis bacteriophora TaxID=37862 RepID=A0A1I7X616_HETBA
MDTPLDYQESTKTKTSKDDLTCMNSHMNLQILTTGEVLITLLARKWLFTCVDTDMVHQFVLGLPMVE